MKVGIVDNPELTKDMETGSIYINDEPALRRYSAAKSRAESNKKLKEEVDSIKKDIDSIKSMLTTLINK
jgi:hypothetical protein